MPKPAKPKVAVIVVGWNNRKLLGDCFESVRSQTHKSWQIIYVDNNSNDDSVDYIKQKFPEVVIMAQSQNTGFARGNNIGVAEALKDEAVEYVCLLNSDARLSPDWLAKMVGFAALKPKGACFQGTTLDYYNHGIIDSTHIYISHNGQGTQGNWRYYLAGELGPKKVFGINAAAGLISRKFIEAQPLAPKLFDESLFMYLEDIDVAARSTIMGWDNYLVPAARAYHMGSASSVKRSSTFSLYMTFRNNSAVLYKNYSWHLIFRVLPKLIRGDIDTVRELRRRGQGSAGWSVVKGRLVGLLRLPLFIGKRWAMRRRQVYEDEYLWQLMGEGY